MLDDSQIGRTFRWGVSSTRDATRTSRAFPPRSSDAASTDRYRIFTLALPTRPSAITSPTAGGSAPTSCTRTARRAGDPLRRLGAQRAQRRAGARRNTAGRVHRNDGRGISAIIPMHRGRGRRLAHRRSADAADLADFAGVRPHPVHVPHHQGRRLGRLPHRPLLALPDRQRRVDPATDPRVERAASGPGRHQELLRGHRSRAGGAARIRLTAASSAAGGSRSGRKRTGRPRRSSGRDEFDPQPAAADPARGPRHLRAARRRARRRPQPARHARRRYRTCSTTWRTWASTPSS